MSAAPSGAEISTHVATMQSVRTMREGLIGNGNRWLKAAYAARVDIHVLKFGVQDRMFLISFDPRTDQLIALARYMKAPRAIDLHLPRHIQEQQIAVR